MKEKHVQLAHDSTFNIMQYVLLKQEHIALGRMKTFEVKLVDEHVLFCDRRDFPLVPRNLDYYQSIVQDNVSFL
jgi:hypothetical protein